MLASRRSDRVRAPSASSRRAYSRPLDVTIEIYAGKPAMAIGNSIDRIIDLRRGFAAFNGLDVPLSK